MSRPPLARERVLDAFERILIEEGERAATMDAAARAAGVSKGGLLYHFGSKAALVEGLADRLERFGAAEEERLSPMPDAVEVFLRESVAAEHPIDRTLVALLKLGQHDEHGTARDALIRLDEHYLTALTASLGDRDLALLVVRLSDGIYLRSAIGGSRSLTPDSVERVILRLEELLR